MQNDYLHTQILIHDDDIQDSSKLSIAGKIIFTPQVDLSVEELGYQVILEAENLYLNRIIPLQKGVFFRNKVMRKGKDYSYDFEFIPHFSSSYYSKKFKLKSAIQTVVNLQTKSYLKIRNDYLKNNRLTTLTDTTQLLWEEHFFSLENLNRNYLIEEQEYYLTNSNLKPWGFFIFSAILASFLIPNLRIANWAQILAIWLTALFLVIIVPQLYKQYILKRIGIKTQQVNENQFGIFLDLTKNWKQVQKVKAEYGSFGNILLGRQHEDIPFGIDFYISPPIEKSKIKYVEENILDFQEVKYDFIFDLPQGNIPVTFDHPKVSSYWEFKITVYFLLGLKSEFIREIKVTQIPPQNKNNITTK